MLLPLWSAFVVGSSVGLLGAAFGTPGVLTKLTAYSLLFNTVSRSGLVRGVELPAAILGVAMAATYWIVLASQGYVGIYGASVTSFVEVPDPFADLMVHLIVPVDAAAWAATHGPPTTTVGAFVLAGVYAILFLSSVPYEFARAMNAGSRFALATGGVVLCTVAECGVVAVWRRRRATRPVQAALPSRKVLVTRSRV